MLVRVRGGGVEEDERLSGSEKARRPDPRQRTRHSRRLSVRSLPSPRRLGRPPRPPSSTLSSCAWQSAETSIPAMVRSLSNSDDACSIRASGVRDGHWVDASPRPVALVDLPFPVVVVVIVRVAVRGNIHPCHGQEPQEFRRGVLHQSLRGYPPQPIYVTIGTPQTRRGRRKARRRRHRARVDKLLSLLLSVISHFFFFDHFSLLSG